MRYEAFRDKDCPDDSGWRVEEVDCTEDHACPIAIFIGENARGRAEEYAAMQNSQIEEPVPQ